MDVSHVDFTKKMNKGSDCAVLFLGVVPFGGASIVEAAQDAEIGEIMAIEYSNHYLVLFGLHCVHVWGR